MKLTPIVALLCLFAAVTLPVATSWGAGAEKPVGAVAAVQWEYLQISPLDSGPMKKEDLNRFGAMGWELVAVVAIPGGTPRVASVSYSYTFKRLKQG